MRRAVITGLGVVSPLGCDREEFWRSLLHGESGIEAITNFDPAPFASQIAGQVRDFVHEDHFHVKELRRTEPFVRFGIVAARRAMEDSGLVLDGEAADRAGVLVGSGIGGLNIMEESSRILLERGPRRLSPFCIPQMICNMLPGMIAIEFGFRGPNFAIVSACATATHSIGEALRMIQHNEADVIVAGGAEAAITQLGVGGFAAMKALSTRNDDPKGASRPFDLDRDGFVIGEGGGVVILEELDSARERGAKMYCEVAGYGRTGDAYHMTAPPADGAGATRSMKLALADAGLTPDDVDYVNAHGTSTSLNDSSETLAIKQALGEDVARKVAVSSTKSMTGHLLGAAGGIEAVACALAIRDGAVPPTINYTTPDPDCDLDYVPNEAREMKVTACLSNSLGFGGHNATLCFKAIE